MYQTTATSAKLTCLFIVSIDFSIFLAVIQLSFVAVEKCNCRLLILPHILEAHFAGMTLMMLGVQTMKAERFFNRRMRSALRKLNDLPLTQFLRSHGGVIRNILSAVLIVRLWLSARALLFRHVLFTKRKAPLL